MNPAIEKAMNALKFVAQHVKNEDNFNSVRETRRNKLTSFKIGYLSWIDLEIGFI